MRIVLLSLVSVLAEIKIQSKIEVDMQNFAKLNW